LEIKLDALPGRLFKAKVEALDPLIDANGRSIGVRALLTNGPGEPVAAAGARKADVPMAAASNTPPSVAKPAVQSALAPAATQSRVVGGVVNLPSPQSLGCPPSMFNQAREASGGSRGGPLRPGMFARVTAVFSTKPNALVVPEEAIVPQGGKQFVIRVVAPGELPAPAAGAASAPALPPGTEWVSRRVEVKLGIRRAGQVEVTDGLEEGDVVVVAGQQRLQKDGSAVRVVQLGRGPANPASGAASGAEPPVGNASAPQAPASR
jgi:multidrug efflux pump subunit AcrA (membrane-fusion protein)